MTLDRLGPLGDIYRPPFVLGLVAQSDAKVLVLLQPGTIVRLLTDGTPDPSFGTLGQIFAVQSVNAIAVQADGKILAAGTPFGGQGLVVSRYLPDGSADPGFGDGGVVTIGNTTGQSADLAVDASGRILVGAAADGGSLLARLQPSNGVLDPSFGSGGVARIAEIYAPELATQPDGKVVVAGTAISPYGDFGLQRLTAAGTLDPTFGTGGYARVALEGRQHIQDVTIDPMGRVVTVGYTMRYGYDELLVTRHTASGVPDDSFATGGVLVAHGPLPANSVAAEPDGSLLLPAVAAAADPNLVAVARLTPDGRLDPDFGASLDVGIDFPFSNGWMTRSARTPDGGWVYAGSGTETDPAVVIRSERDGSRDPADTGTACVRNASLTRAGGPDLQAAIGTRTPPQVLTLTNTGFAPLTVGAAAIRGDATQFALAADGCSLRTLPAGGSCQVSVVYAPTGSGIPDHMANVLIPNNGPTGYATTSFEGIPTAPATLQAPYSAWMQPTATPLDGLGTWVAAANDTTAGTGQAPPSYLYGLGFGFANNPARGALGLLTLPSGKFAAVTVVEADGTTHSAAVPFAWSANRLYYPFAYQLSPGVWGAWVYDYTAGAWTGIGTLSLPSGWGKIAPATATLAAWVGAPAGACGAYPRGDVFVLAPTGFVGSVPSAATLTSSGTLPGNCAPGATSYSGGWARYRLGTA